MSFRAIFGKKGKGAVDVDKGDAPLVTSHLQSWRLFEAYPDRTHITILRDPEERVRSYVRYMRGVRGNTNGDPIDDYARMLPASVFLRLDLQPIRHMTHDRQVRQLGADHLDDPEELMPAALEQAVESLDRMAWVGHTETLTADIDDLFEKVIGVANPKLSPQNSSLHNPLSDTSDLDRLTRWDTELLEAWSRR